MPELRLQVPQSLVDEINSGLRDINSDKKLQLSLTEIAREALTYYKWAVEQTGDGKAVVATNKDHTNMVQLSTPALPAKKPRI